MRIVHLLAPAPFGGLERVVTLLAAGLHRRGHAVSVGALVEQGAVQEPGLVKALAQTGVPVEVIRAPHRAYRRERAMVRSLLQGARPDVVHTHGYHADVLAAPVARGMGCPVVATVHGYIGGGLKNRWYEWLDRRALRRMDAVLAVAGPLRSRLIRSGVAAERVHLVRNSYTPPGEFLARAEARRRLGIAAGAPLVGWVGRVTPEKGLDLALHALRLAANPNLELSVIGAGRMEPELRAVAAAHGLADRVHWHGAVEEAWRCFPAFDVFCLSSRTEGTPMVVLEAMAARVPIVATGVGGVPDLLGPAEGFVVTPEDPAALARALERALGEEGAHRATEAERRLLAEFGVEPWLERHVTIYRAVAGGRVAA